MINQVFEVSVIFFNRDSDRFKETHRIYSKSQAIQYGMEFGNCSNVERVDVADAFTGELILCMIDQKIEWLTEED